MSVYCWSLKILNIYLNFMLEYWNKTLIDWLIERMTNINETNGMHLGQTYEGDYH